MLSRNDSVQNPISSKLTKYNDGEASRATFRVNGMKSIYNPNTDINFLTTNDMTKTATITRYTDE